MSHPLKIAKVTSSYFEGACSSLYLSGGIAGMKKEYLPCFRQLVQAVMLHLRIKVANY
jgi:hypothetical protein